MNASLLRALRLLPAALVAGLYMSCGPYTPYEDEPYEEEYPYGSTTSTIVPMAPLVPGTDSIRLVTPSFARTFPMSQKIAFEFGTSGYANGVLIVMDERPQVADGRVANFASACVAGAASMSGSAFDGFLSASPSTSDLLVCTGDPARPFAAGRSVKICPEIADTCLRSGIDYWWFVLGYDEQMRLTRTSPAFRFRLGN